MVPINNVSAVFFDMDGTLVDSEIFTTRAAHTVCSEFGIARVDLDCTAFYGTSWEEIAEALIDRYPVMAGPTVIAGRMHEIYRQLLVEEPPDVIRMARESVIAASELMPTAIVSSSLRESIEETIRRLDIESHVSFYAGADDCDEAKPSPDGYLKAAKYLDTRVGECLVFEDSIAGIQAARNAGMQVIAITHRTGDIETVTSLADMAIRDFSELDARFFERVMNRD